MALVFLSCGQRNSERKLALQIQQMIQDEFGIACYNADSAQGFDDVMSITEKLSKADYYLFIDFKRDGKLPISVFAHQEFALARAWGITEMIARQTWYAKRFVLGAGTITTLATWWFLDCSLLNNSHPLLIIPAKASGGFGFYLSATIGKTGPRLTL